jgi:hypothetical protein
MNYEQETKYLEPGAQLEDATRPDDMEASYTVSFDGSSRFDCTDVHPTSAEAWRQAFEIIATEKVALEFSRVLRHCIGGDMAEVVRRNSAEPAGSGVCHSHDFCDANMAMLEAFHNLGLRATVEIEPVDGPEWCASQDLWNAAWDAAVASGFSTEVAR